MRFFDLHAPTPLPPQRSPHLSRSERFLILFGKVLLSVQIDYFLVQLTNHIPTNKECPQKLVVPPIDPKLITLHFTQLNIAGVYTTILFDLQSIPTQEITALTC